MFDNQPQMYQTQTHPYSITVTGMAACKLRKKKSTQKDCSERLCSHAHHTTRPSQAEGVRLAVHTHPLHLRLVQQSWRAVTCPTVGRALGVPYGWRALGVPYSWQSSQSALRSESSRSALWSESSPELESSGDRALACLCPTVGSMGRDVWDCGVGQMPFVFTVGLLLNSHTCESNGRPNMSWLVQIF